MQPACFAMLAVLFAMPTFIQSRLSTHRSVNLWSSRPATNMGILVNGNVIVASKNKMVLFDDKLDAIGQHRTCEKQTDTDKCENINKVMILNKADSQLVVCGTGNQGKCEILQINESNFTVRSTNPVRISTDIKRPAVGCITANVKLTFAVTNGPGESNEPGEYNIPIPYIYSQSTSYAISKRQLSDLEHFSGAKFDDKFDHFVIYYKDVIQIGNYSYIVTNQDKNGKIEKKPKQMISKVARVCENDFSLGMIGYVDFGIECEDESRTKYNLIQHVTKAVVHGKTWIFGVFTRGDDAENLSGDSVVCATTLADVNHTVNETWRDFVLCPNDNINLTDDERYFKDSRIIDGKKTCLNESDRDYKEEDFVCTSLAKFSYNIGVRQLKMTFKYRVDSSRGLVTAASMTRLSNNRFPVLLLGTSKGKLIMTNVLSGGNIEVYDSHSFKNEHPIRSIQQKDNDTLYILSETKLHEMRSTDCSGYTTCKSTMDDHNPLCGWCVLKSKATRYEDCGSQKKWLAAIEGECPHLSPSPEGVRIGTTTTVTITMENVPAMSAGDVYKCVFSSLASQKNYTMDATRVGNSITCQAPTDVKNHTKANLEVRVSNIVLGSTTFMFYNCDQFKKCGDCLASSNIQCTWDSTMLVCGATDATSSGIHKSSCPQLLDNKIFIASGQTTTISLNVQNLVQNAAFVYKCQVGTGCFPATLSNGNLDCSIMLQTTANKTEKEIVVKYRPSSSPDAQCNNMISIDDTHDNTVTVYNCSALANGDCSICCALNHTRYKCTWKTNDCMYDDSPNQCDDNKKCPPPVITLDPQDGPTHGGTRLTLTGKNFGHWTSSTADTLLRSESVKIGNITCPTSKEEDDFDVNKSDDFSKAFPQRIVCIVEPISGQKDTKKKVTLKLIDVNASSNAADFWFKQPKVTQVIPRRGPEAGGTRITLIGENLRIGNNIVHVILNKNIKCTDVKVPFIIGKSSNITCLTGIYLDQPQNGSIYIYLDREPEASRPYQYPNEQYPAISFKYVANPKIDVVDPQIGFLSGGTSLTVTGKNLDVAHKLTITSSEDSLTVSSCVIISPKEITCRVPNLSDQQKEEIEEIIKRKRRKRSASGKDCVEIPMSIKLDGYTYEFKIEYCRDPKLEKFKDGGVLVYESDDKSIKIDGQYLKLVAKDTDFKVTVGLGECKIIEVTDTQITCTPPEERSDNTEVYVEVGNIRESVGRLDYTKTVDLIGILAGVGCGVFVVVVVVVVSLCYKRNVKKQAKKYEGDLKNMEMEIIDVARQEFLDMHTTMSSVNRSLVEQGFPYHTYQQYACNVMFAVDYLWTEPVMTDDERLRANKGMEALEKLIHNKFFLVSVISSLEKQKKFFIREKSNLAGNLCAVLMGKMDYLNEVLCLLMKNMVQDSSGKKAQQKALFRRCEKLTEKLLSNWMSLCLYPHFMSHSGSPLYLLYIALQKTIEAGPIDAETGDAKYTLSEEKLLKKISSSMSEESLKFESKSLTLNVVVNEGEEIFKCKVLDCDTISQVKSKCLSQIYVNFPASKLDVDPDELILEWHEGFGGALRLQDHDNTSSQEGSWVRLNTLAHYNVKDESNLALVDPHSAEVMQQEDYVNLTQVNMDVGGCNGSMDSTDPLTTPPETHDELQYWHLVKKEEESSKKEKSAIAELYLNRLFTTKMSLKEYIKTMFDIVLDKDHCPPPAKFLLNYLDELGEQFKVDNDTIHGWKSHSYAIRVWAALMKMPSLLFDVNIPSYMTDNLEVISQVFIDSFTLSSQKFTKDSPSQKLIFHNEMLECRERALEFYKNVKVDSQDHEELRKYLVEVNKLQQQTDFNKTSALYRFYKQTKPYLIDIVEDLATGKETKDLQLDKKLERVMQIMDEEDDDE